MFIPKEAEEVQYIESKELQQWLSQSNAPELIDVRDYEKHQKFNIGGSNISIYEFAGHINDLDPDTPVVVYCQVGQKSFNAASLLIQSDFSCVYSLKGGIEAWKKQPLFNSCL